VQRFTRGIEVVGKDLGEVEGSVDGFVVVERGKNEVDGPDEVI
jgi:hypothetical protein